MNFSVGVDLGGTNLRVAAIDERGTVLDKITLGTQIVLGRERVIDDICAGVRHLAGKYASSATLAGIGIGVPGIIDMEAGMVRSSSNLPGWAGSPLRSELEERLGTRVILENDGNVAALGENWLGAAREVRDLAILTLGTGVGGGIIVEGKVWHGTTGMAGEFGHMTVEPEGPACGCGNRGCLEQYASATAVVRMAREAIASGAAPRLAAEVGDGRFSAQTVYELAIQGDEAAAGIFRTSGWALGIVLASLVNALNLSMYVVAGGMASAWEAFAPSLFEELRRRSLVYGVTASPAQPHLGAQARSDPGASSGTRVTRALLGSDAGLYGAARLPMIRDR
jgi:glucokinase